MNKNITRGLVLVALTGGLALAGVTTANAIDIDLGDGDGVDLGGGLDLGDGGGDLLGGIGGGNGIVIVPEVSTAPGADAGAEGNTANADLPITVTCSFISVFSDYESDCAGDSTTPGGGGGTGTTGGGGTVVVDTNGDGQVTLGEALDANVGVTVDGDGTVTTPDNNACVPVGSTGTDVNAGIDLSGAGNVGALGGAAIAGGLSGVLAMLLARKNGILG